MRISLPLLSIARLTSLCSFSTSVRASESAVETAAILPLNWHQDIARVQTLPHPRPHPRKILGNSATKANVFPVDSSQSQMAAHTMEP